MYILIFWMPYSQAVIEITVILALILWIIKRILVFSAIDRISMSWGKTAVCFLKSFGPPRNQLTTPIFVFLGFCLVSAVLSDSFSNAVHGLITKTCEWFVIFFLVCESFREKKHVLITLTALIISGCALALDSFWQYYITHRDIFLGRTIEPGARAIGSFEAPSSLGAVYTILLPLIAFMFLDKTRKWWMRVFILGVVVIFTWSMILSFSRGAILGVSMSGFFVIFVFLYHLQQKKVKAYVCLYAAALLIIMMSKISLGEYSQFGFLNRSTSDFRIILWDDTFKMIKDKPFFGHGTNTYMKVFKEKYRRKALGKYLHYMTYSDHSPTYAHNCYLQIWAEAGIFSLIAFLWILFRLFKDSIRHIKILFNNNDQFKFLSLGLLSGLVAFLTQSFFDTNFYSLQLSSYFWFMAGIQMVINRTTMEQEGTQYAAA